MQERAKNLIVLKIGMLRDGSGKFFQYVAVVPFREPESNAILISTTACFISVMCTIFVKPYAYRLGGINLHFALSDDMLWSFSSSLLKGILLFWDFVLNWVAVRFIDHYIVLSSSRIIAN